MRYAVVDISDQLLVPPSDLTVYEGNAAQFSCLPDMTISRQQLISPTSNSSTTKHCKLNGPWIKDGCPLQESEQTVFLPDGGLLIRNVSYSSQEKHQFCCIFAVPGIMKGPFCAQLTVLRSSGVSQAPTIAVKPKDVTIQAGNNVVIPCVGKGVPSPHVSWYNPNGKEVKSKENCKVRVIEPGILIVEKAKPRNSGVYQCVVKAGSRQKVTNVTMNVSVIVSGDICIIACFLLLCLC